MWKQIFLFELKYRKKRPATWIYFLLMFVMGLLVTSTDVIQVSGGSNLLKENSPYSIANMMAALALVFGTFFTSAIMGVAIIRDFEHKTEAMFFTAPISKFDYIFGRFLGSFLILSIVLFGIVLGMMAGNFWPGITEDFWPARDPEKLMPFNFMTYIRPYFILILPNAFIAGSIFFMVGGLSRRMVIIYLQAIGFLILQSVADIFLGDLDNKKYAAWLDPSGGRAFSLLTEYWTISEKNGLQIPFSNEILYNRILWLAIGIVSFWATIRFFSFNQVVTPIIRRKAGVDVEFIKNSRRILPKVTQNFGFGSQLAELWKMVVFYFKNTIKDVPFIGIFAFGFFIFGVNAIFMDGFNDTKMVPTTYRMVQLINAAFLIFNFIIIVFYSGELVWQERDVKINLIQDATPVPTAMPLIAKYFSIILSLSVITLFLIFCSIITQASNGYFKFELGIYFKSLFGETIPKLMVWTLFAFFIQVMVNNKVAGYATMILFFILLGVISSLGVEHPLLRFNSGGLGTYSDMNTFGHFITPFTWLSSYWTAFTMFLFAVAIVFASRGSEELFKLRLKIGKYRLNRSLITIMLLAIVSFVSMGAYIYYNLNKVNTYQSSKEQEKQQGNYEKTLKKYENTPQPRIVETKLNVDIFPEKRNFVAEGYFILKNKTAKPISEIHIQESADDEVNNEYIKLEREAKLDNRFVEDFGFRIYQLSKPLQPQDSIKMSFKTIFTTKGFKTGSNTRVIENGTFFNNLDFFPTLGYNNGFELGQDDTRKKQKLKPKERMKERTDPIGLGQNLLGDDADEIRFEITMSTSPDQIAISPGYLQKEWTKDGRRYFHYKMDAPMFNFYSMVSARYEVKKEIYKGISLEIYYHKGHEYNLDRMMKGIKTSLDYYQKNFTPYQHRQVRIMEFPRYASFAQSFANTIPFSEGIGFIQKIRDDKDDVDMPFYITCHEVAHQWWGHQVAEAQVKGNAMLSETMSQYSALMCMKQTFSKEQMKKFLKQELNSYLLGRGSEDKKEQPLEFVESQGYIHYNKGSLVMYALQDYVGENIVNQGFKNYLNQWNTKNVEKLGRYPTSADMIAELKIITPDSLKYLYKDLFETITLFENKTEKASFKENKGKFTVKIDLKAEKLRADKVGNESKIAMNDWVWIGVYGEKQKDKDRLIYYQRHKISKDKTSIEVVVNEKPTKAGIDPLNILIDRHPDDNTKSVEKL